jgi:hypothetical protein
MELCHVDLSTVEWRNPVLDWILIPAPERSRNMQKLSRFVCPGEIGSATFQDPSGSCSLTRHLQLCHALPHFTVCTSTYTLTVWFFATFTEELSAAKPPDSLSNPLADWLTVHYWFVLKHPLFVYSVIPEIFRPVLGHRQDNHSHAAWEVTADFTFASYIC